jgi:uncharacterized RDD family membrane protein YckC
VERLGAYVLDQVIIGGIAVIPTLVLLFTLLVPPLLDDVRAQQAAGTRVPTVNVEHFFLRYLLVLACGLAVQVVVGVLYEVLYQARTGQTVGKRVMGIRTIQVDGGALTRGSATKRYLTQLGCSLVPGLGYVDGLWQLWDKPLRQCLHDKAAQTVVVKV